MATLSGTRTVGALRALVGADIAGLVNATKLKGASLQVTDGATAGWVLKANDDNGNAYWAPESGGGGGSGDTQLPHHEIGVDTTLNATHCVVMLVNAAANVTITLPLLSTVYYGRPFYIINGTTNRSVTIQPTAPDTIDGSSGPMILASKNEKVTLIGGTANNATWEVV